MKFRKLTVLVALTTALGAGVASADVVLNDWYFNPAGSGLGTARQISQYWDITGNAFIDLTDLGGGNFSFTEYGVFKSTGSDGGGNDWALDSNFNREVTALLTATGVGNFGSGFSFTAGTLSMYAGATFNYGSLSAGVAPVFGANDGTPLATLSVIPGGGGAVDPNGNPVSNGVVTLLTKFDSMAANTWFMPNGSPMGLDSVVGFAFTNANPISNPTTIAVREIICEGAGATPAGTNCATGTGYANVAKDYVFVSNNGQFKLNAVPEPGSLALIGLGMLGLAFASRRKT